MAFTIEKQWDENECEREGANGRVYVSRGRWQWVVIEDGVADMAFDTRQAARARINRLMGGVQLELVRALQVIALTPQIRAFLVAHDPKALAQVEQAIARGTR